MRKMFSKKQIDGMILAGTEVEKSLLQHLAVENLFLGGDIRIEIDEVEYVLGVASGRVTDVSTNYLVFSCIAPLVDVVNGDPHGIVSVNLQIDLVAMNVYVNMEYLYNPENIGSISGSPDSYDLLFLLKNKFYNFQR